MGKNIDTIIFDLGMVLVNFCWQDHLNSFSFSEEVYKKVANAMFLSPEWNEYDRGELSEEEMLKLFIKNDATVEKEIKMVYKNLGNTVKRYSYTDEWISQLKEKGFRLLFLSNFSEKTLREAKEDMEFHEKLDGGIFSFQVKMVKPELQIYETFLKRFSVDPHRTVFLDDSQKNLDGAKAFGIHTILFTTKEEAERQLRIQWEDFRY